MATKEAYQKKLQAQLSAWDAQFALLGAKVDKASADARIKYEDELAVLKKKQLAVRANLDELGRRGENAWEDLRVAAERGWEDMNKALERFAARFK